MVIRAVVHRKKLYLFSDVFLFFSFSIAPNTFNFDCSRSVMSILCVVTFLCHISSYSNPLENYFFVWVFGCIFYKTSRVACSVFFLCAWKMCCFWYTDANGCCEDWISDIIYWGVVKQTNGSINLVISSSGNDQSPLQCQAITWTNVDLLSIRTL